MNFFLRSLFTTCALFTGMLVLAAGTPTAFGPKLGLQSWTCRNMNFDEVVDFAAKQDIHYVELVAPMHLDPAAPPEENLRKKAQLEAKGITAYSFGVVRPTPQERDNRPLFELAKLMGMKLIIVEPQDAAAWDNLEKLVKEYDIKVAIHNHGTGTVYGNPATVKKILATRDARIGVCLDVGWVSAAGFDAAQVFTAYGDRVFDMHLKDKRKETGADGRPLDVEIGQGIANYAGVFAAIARTGWTGVMAIETDNKDFAREPGHFVDQARKFFEAQRADAVSRASGK